MRTLARPGWLNLFWIASKSVAKSLSHTPPKVDGLFLPGQILTPIIPECSGWVISVTCIGSVRLVLIGISEPRWNFDLLNDYSNGILYWWSCPCISVCIQLNVSPVYKYEVTKISNPRCSKEKRYNDDKYIEGCILLNHLLELLEW